MTLHPWNEADYIGSGEISKAHHYCPVKREGESLKALNGGRFNVKKSGVDLNVKMKIRKNSGVTTSGAAHEHRQDAVRPTDGFSAVDDLHPTCRSTWWTLCKKAHASFLSVSVVGTTLRKSWHKFKPITCL